VKIFSVWRERIRKGRDRLNILLFTNDLHSYDNAPEGWVYRDRHLQLKSWRFAKQDQALERQDKTRFVDLVLPHLDAAFNLARWLVKNSADAEDLVQEAMLRAYRSFAQFRADDARGWLLQIVHSSCYAWLQRNHPIELMPQFDEERRPRPDANPKKHVAPADEQQLLMRELESLVPRTREVLILREMEGCSYQEIADITGIPIDCVTSTLSLARERLLQFRKDDARTR
jgi:RNA polymerase sigma-70 factor, ECF subfamily